MNDNIIFGLHILKERTNDNMKKRLVTLIVAGTLLMSSLAGCGSVSDTETDTTPQAQEETVVENAETPTETEESTVEETTESAEEAKALEATEHLTNGRASLYGLDGTEINLETAYNEFTKAVELGNLDANFYMGLLCDWYSYPEENFEIAKSYYEASGDNVYAKINLAFLYCYGSGVTEDKEKASNMFKEVIEQGYAEGYLGSAYMAYDEGDYTTAMDFLNKSLDGTEQVYTAWAMNKIANMYLNGEGVEQNNDLAVEWYQKAGEAGQKNALNELGAMYYSGNGVEQDYAKAVEYFEKSANLGNLKAMANVAFLYEKGYGTDQNYTMALKYYEMSANKGNSTAMHKIGLFYQQGYGVEQDYTKAYEYYKMSADLDNVNGISDVGYCYEQGWGVEQDYEKALEYYDKATELGSEGAKQNADRLRKQMQ